MDAFIAAEQAGAEGIELDVHLSRDRQLVVIHDKTVNRTTNKKGLVKDFSLTELKKLDASYTFKNSFEKQRIPSLVEVFDWLQTNDLLCNIELKNNAIPYEKLEEKVIALIREYHFEDRIIISSFNHYSLVHCYRLAPEIETAPLYAERLFMPWIYAKSIFAKGIHPSFKVASEKIIKATLENGIAVRPYTVNKERDMERFISLQSSAIITDFPEKAINIRKKSL